jgi:TetR/AcrR family transcriptional regulator
MSPNTAPPAAEASARDRLVTAALGLFNSRGYAATTVREICAAAGVTKPVLYYHFQNKEGIYLHVMNEGFREFRSAIEQALTSGGDARQRLLRLLLGAYELFLRHVPEVRLMHAIYYGPPQGAPNFDFDRTHQDFEGAVKTVIEQGIAEGVFRPAPILEMTFVVSGTLNMAIELHLCHPEASVGPEGLARMLDVVLAGIAADRSAVGQHS